MTRENRNRHKLQQDRQKK